ncbi:MULTISPECIES: ABC transporter permease [Sphingobacterium]|jgi:glycine betaine/proline transport system permease protein|uniref:Proline/glycine betaine ABC transporter permease n=4 Tax=Sphingobacterium TaxID=28453 RepID=A0ABX7CUN3_SPHMU|nr:MULTISPECIES: proline/glycine betaine ABC transporter permease [Sphingobacterium]APU98369.1 glycine/betaine ABC transporter [Sphingobacterium sp. B29]MBB1646958.1 glycine/betaine ABC transporter [Sphingobacterium sp. UME9]MCS4163533.1 glycine betaine/proline transport system permease protein [Sphingobacterium sp. BIGb0116]QMV66571.1 proline/glycine betaine ABC transporter permease [Sphingobacterium paramultivorum]QQT46762.1 proline/glycine betaine ABC transporter permease [Sphingobacterium 
MNKVIDIGQYIAVAVNWLTDHLEPFFNLIKNTGNASIIGLEWVLTTIPFFIIIALFTGLAWWKSGKGVALTTLVGLTLIYLMGFWIATMETLALVLVATLTALVISVPLGVWAAKNKLAAKIIRPLLDLMQTMPAFVYLIPAVLFFSIGKVPGAFATIIFAMPPAVRLTTLGIDAVPKDIVEAARSFGATNSQILFKVELPLATKTILAGINQTILLSLSMVVIAGMIAAGGLGEKVLEGINNLDIGLGFESGLSVVILAIILDRITQGFVKKKA